MTRLTQALRTTKPHVRLFEQNRDILYGIAYRMLGSMSDAEDIVQDAWFRWRDTDIGRVDSPRAFLATVVSRLCVDRQRRRKIEKLNYTGPWLPEPVAEDDAPWDNPEGDISLMENVSIAFLFLLERLTPLERAVFILKESFDFAHQEIAAMLGIEAAHSRQLLRRARNRLGEIPDSAHQVADDESRAVMQRFAEALASRDIESLRQLLTDDIVAYSDGGGRVRAALIPLVGFEKVTTVLLHLGKRGAIPEKSRWHIINGAWGTVMYEDDGIHSVTTTEIRDGKICRIYTMRNPDKLRYVGHDLPRQHQRGRRLSS